MVTVDRTLDISPPLNPLFSHSPPPMSSPIPPPPPSPGVAHRRKGPKSLPKLPISAFTPPTSSTGDSFPLPPSPATAHPASIIDANVAATPSQLPQWEQDAGQVLAGRIGGVVLTLRKEVGNVDKILKEIENNSAAIPVLSVAIPFSLGDPVPEGPPPYFNSPVRTSLSTVYTEKLSDKVASLRWALQQGRPIDIDIQTNMHDADAVWENFEDLLSKSAAELDNPASIILSNVLPPPYAHALPLVQLMNHPTYRAFQTQIAALSLFPNLYIKFLPPAWDSPTPAALSPATRAQYSHLVLSQTPVSAVTPSSASPASGLWAGKGEDTDNNGEMQQLKDWKRRIRMYLGPVVEAFGYSRIIFGSSPSALSQSQSNTGDWYQIARDSFLELGVDQEAVDSVFGLNAKVVYGN